jgi:hypothetical protein
MSARDWHADAERLRDDLAAYALDALAPQETAELEDHLDGCASCRERLLWLRPAVDVLPGSVEQLTPPDRLRERLLATVRAEATTAGEPDRARWWERLRSFALRPAVAIAALIVLTVGVAAGYLLRGSAEEGATLAAHGVGPQAAQVEATLERHDGSATLHVERMPKLARDQVYAVWVQRHGVMEPRSTFVLGSHGGAEAAVPGPLDDAEAVYVTVEPRPGGEEPTSDPVLEAPLQ